MIHLPNSSTFKPLLSQTFLRDYLEAPTVLTQLFLFGTPRPRLKGRRGQTGEEGEMGGYAPQQMTETGIL